MSQVHLGKRSLDVWCNSKSHLIYLFVFCLGSIYVFLFFQNLAHAYFGLVFSKAFKSQYELLELQMNGLDHSPSSVKPRDLLLLIVDRELVTQQDDSSSDQPRAALISI